MNRVLIITDSPKKSISLEKQMPQKDELDVNRAESFNQAQQIIKTLSNKLPELDVVVIQKEITEELISFCKMIIEKTKASILYIEENPGEEAVQLSDLCLYKLSSDYKKEQFEQIIQFMIKTKKRYCEENSESQNHKKEIEEVKIVNRAKCVLIQYLNMTETQAHKYIEKQAMNLRLSKAEISENILKTYETTIFPDR